MTYRNKDDLFITFMVWLELGFYAQNSRIYYRYFILVLQYELGSSIGKLNRFII